jgi:hypothetical protein
MSMAKKSKQVQEASAAARAASKETEAASTARRADRRPDAVRKRKDQRKQEYEKQQRQWFYTKIGIGAVAAIVVGALAWGAWGQYQEWRVTRDVEEYFGAHDFDGIHFNEGEILYEQVPPTGGPHRPPGAWQNCGFYSEYIENERGVHSLEHGSVWITYDPDLPQDQIDILREKAESSSKVLVSPYPGMDAPVIASVWGKQIKLDGADDDRLDPFISHYVNNPGNTPEIGGICWSGISATTDTVPQQEPYIRTEGSVPIGGVLATDATATAEALNPSVATPPASTPAASTPGVVATPAAASGTPVGTPGATPDATPAS